MLSTDRPAGNDGDFNLPTRSAAADGTHTGCAQIFNSCVCAEQIRSQNKKRNQINVGQCTVRYGALPRTTGRTKEKKNV